MMWGTRNCVYRSGNCRALSSAHGGVGPAAASGLKSLWLAMLYPRSQLPQATSHRVWWNSIVVVVVATPDYALLERQVWGGHWWVLYRAKVESMSMIPEGQYRVRNWTSHSGTMKSPFCGLRSSRQACLHFKEEAIA